MKSLQKATNQQTRLINHQLVLRTIYDRNPISRADVARATGLTRTTVSDVVEQLLGAGLAEEIGLGARPGARRRSCSGSPTKPATWSGLRSATAS